MVWHAQSVKEVFLQLKSSERGLTNSEAGIRISTGGYNDLSGIRKKWIGWMFLRQFNSFLIYILILAAAFSFFIGHTIDAIVIGSIVFLNASIGFIQEYKAESIIEKLKQSLKYNVLVLRDEKHEEIDSKNLVPGDVVLIKAGDRIPADCRIFSEDNFLVNESILTGESMPVEKNGTILHESTVLAERRNMIYAGTIAVSGKCIAVVVNTGRKTEFGNLAELVQQTKDERMPLEKKIDSFSKTIALIAIILVVITFFIGISAGIDKIDMLLTSISLAVGVIPEGLPAVIVIVLAIAVKQMHSVKTLVRKLPAAETLGRATVICTDKTGTLTEEMLEVDEIYSKKLYDVESIKKLDNNIRQTILTGILCNNARDEDDKILGDPTEIALIKIAKNFGLDKKKETEDNLRVKEFGFSSERKMMSIVRSNGKILTSYVKGASSIVLQKCTKEYSNGKIKSMTEKRRKDLIKVYNEMEDDGLRVLAFAFRQLPSGKVSQDSAESYLIFLGFMGMIDPPRKEVKDAIRQAIETGIEIKIITGDSAKTTRAIANKIGLNGDYIESKDLDMLDEDGWFKVVREKTIFARINPEQKLKIIEILKKQNHTVAVTGDGVNDILALKRADIGISMGIRGADVARDSSDMVLLDDNFASIINAIKEGRRVFANLKKSIKFLLAANAADIFIIIFALLLGLPLPLLPLAILWMNLVTDSLPALAIAVEPAESDIMSKKVKKESDSLLSGIWRWILVAGVLNFVSVLGVFYWALNNVSLEVARTMAVSVGIMFQMFFAFACKSNKSLFKTGVMDNKWLVYSVFASIALHILAVHTLLGKALGFVPLSFMQWLFIFLVSLLGLFAFEVWKIIRYSKPS